MIYLLDTSQDYDACAAELGVVAADLGQLITPNTSFSNRGRELYAIDNGGFSKRDPAGFLRILEREKPNRDKCLFVALPDVVCDARRTLECFLVWHLKPELFGWKKALVLQNGIGDFPIPWYDIDAVFIRGDDAFKGSRETRAAVAAAQWLGKHVHMGRVNTPQRVALAEEMGCDSVDGMCGMLLSGPLMGTHVLGSRGELI